MRRFRVALFMLCIALLGALPFVISLPKSDVPGAQQEVAVQWQTTAQEQTVVQRQIGAQRVRAQIGAPLKQALELARAGEYNQALEVVDGLQRISNKTSSETAAISQMRQYLVFAANGLTDRQIR